MSTTINFGKHKGKTIEQLKTEDINWLIWMTKNFNVYSFSSPNPYARLKQSTINERQALLNSAKSAVNEYFESLAEENRKESDSEFVGTMGSKQTLSLRVISVDVKYDYAIVKTETAEGNRVYFYDKGFNLESDQVITATGRVCKQTEVVGVKVTYINRVKIQINE